MLSSIILIILNIFSFSHAYQFHTYTFILLPGQISLTNKRQAKNTQLPYQIVDKGE